MAVGTTARYVCGDEERRAHLRGLLARDDVDPSQVPNGVDFLEVIDVEAEGRTPSIDDFRQRVLVVQCFKEAPQDLRPGQVRIDGGVRVTGIGVDWVRRLDDLHQVRERGQGSLPGAVREFLNSAEFDRLPRSRVLVIGTDSRGDHSTYRLDLVNDVTLDPTPLDGFDPRLGSVHFSFKVECPSLFDCAPQAACPQPTRDEPLIDYLAKDYHGFRRLMLDRMSLIAPEWRERHPADLGIALVELLAYVADRLSYAQDAAVTETYLGTARLRSSVRRHARLVDYFVDDGANARAWVAFEVDAAADGITLPGPSQSGAPSNRHGGSRLLTRLPGRAAAVKDDEDLLENVEHRARPVFETMHEISLHSSLNEIRFHTWSDRDCCLPVGATAATLRGELEELRKGDFLLLEEVKGPQTGSPADADPRKRHVVRVVGVQFGEDVLPFPEGEENELVKARVTEVRWHEADALPFPLCISSTNDEGNEIDDVSVARGNVVLADHGLTYEIPTGQRRPVTDALPAVESSDVLYRPAIDERPLTQARKLPEGFLISPEMDRAGLEQDDIHPASAAIAADAAGERRLAPGGGESTAPAIWLAESTTSRIWKPRRDLIASGAFAAEFVPEIAEDGRTSLRFGDDRHGMKPNVGTVFHPSYRIGSGTAGNIGGEALRHVLADVAGIKRVRNPLPATGGREPEDIDGVRQWAPQAFRVQERAVTPEDYARIAERHRDVQRAAATFRWTGSWTTVFVTVDRRGGRTVDTDFESQLVTYLNRYRMAGYDVAVDGPRFVSLDVELEVCVLPEYDRSQVRGELFRVLSADQLPDGRRGFFHPDLWTFGQPVHRSQLEAAVVGVAGVRSVVVRRFQRWGERERGELESGILPVDRLEIARLDNDPSLPENGRLDIQLGGGR